VSVPPFVQTNNRQVLQSLQLSLKETPFVQIKESEDVQPTDQPHASQVSVASVIVSGNDVGGDVTCGVGGGSVGCGVGGGVGDRVGHRVNRVGGGVRGGVGGGVGGVGAQDDGVPKIQISFS